MSLIVGSYEKFLWGFKLKPLTTNTDPNFKTLTLLFSYPSHLSAITSLAVAGSTAASGGLSLHPSGKVALTVGKDECLAMINLVRGRRSFYCRLGMEVYKHMKAPINVYQLDNYYQNHRRYVKSKNDKQLLNGLGYNDTSSCEPEELNNGLPRLFLVV